MSYFSLSTSDGQIAGSNLLAPSSSENRSAVAARAIRDALRACTKGSRSDRENAATSTLVRDYNPAQQGAGEATLQLTFGPRFFAIFPKQIVVLVRIPGWSSLAVFARYRSSSPLIVRSESLPMTTRTAFTVCSRTMGARSVNPVT